MKVKKVILKADAYIRAQSLILALFIPFSYLVKDIKTTVKFLQ